MLRIGSNRVAPTPAEKREDVVLRGVAHLPETP
jgi:hypothetical protein